MLTKKKLILGCASALALFTLAACGNSSSKIASFQGGQVTVQDFYDEAKMSQTSQQLIQQMIIYGVFEQKYGDKVDDKEVQKQFDQAKEQAGENFSTLLEQNGLTEATLKTRFKQQLAFEAGLKAHVDVTDADLKTAWESFHPEVEAQIIQAASEEDAKAILEEVKKTPDDFTKIAEEKSTDTTTKADGGKVTFDSTSTTIPAEVMTAAFKLKDGEISDVISVTNQQTFTQAFYIVKMTKTSEKGNDMDKFKDQIHEIAVNNQVSDSSFQNKVIGEVLKAANVKIEDTALSNILSGFMPTDTTGTSGSDTSDTSGSN